MDKPVLDLDLDGVVCDYAGGLAAWLKRNGRLAPGAEPRAISYVLNEAHGWPFRTRAEYLEAHREAEEDGLYATLPEINGVGDALRRLDADGVYIRVVTHRLFVSGQHRKVVSDTAQWLDDHGIPYRSLCFTGLKDTLHAALHLDDSPTNLSALMAAGEKVCVFDQAYNRGMRTPRIIDWSNMSVTALEAMLGL